MALLYHNGEGYTAFAVVFEAQGATVKAYYLARDGKADAWAVGFGSEEWREDIFGYLGGDSRAIVGNLDLDTFLSIYLLWYKF